MKGNPFKVGALASMALEEPLLINPSNEFRFKESIRGGEGLDGTSGKEEGASKILLEETLSFRSEW
jgi:hypothetical protein